MYKTKQKQAHRQDKLVASHEEKEAGKGKLGQGTKMHKTKHKVNKRVVQ